MEHNKERAINAQDPPATVPALAAHLETFAKAVAEGASHIQAAVTCGRRPGSASFLYAQPGVKERIAELQTIARNATEKAMVENAIKLRGAVDIDRNEIINILTEIARDPQQPGRVRVSALRELKDIFGMSSRNSDHDPFAGWTVEELAEYHHSGRWPSRYAAPPDDSVDED